MSPTTAPNEHFTDATEDGGKPLFKFPGAPRCRHGRNNGRPGAFGKKRKAIKPLTRL